jgi:hypothetical protein
VVRMAEETLRAAHAVTLGLTLDRVLDRGPALRHGDLQNLNQDSEPLLRRSSFETRGEWRLSIQLPGHQRQLRCDDQQDPDRSGR